MTIKGAKNMQSNINKLDDHNSSLKTEYYNDIKNKTKSVLKKLNKLKNYGKNLILK